MLTITIESAKGVLVKFDWEATSEEFERLYNAMEQMAESQGHNPSDVANQVIRMVATKGELIDDEVQRRGQGTWIVYAVLRYASEKIDQPQIIDQAGVIKGTPTIFDLAEHQHIKATMRLGDKRIEMNVWTVDNHEPGE